MVKGDLNEMETIDLSRIIGSDAFPNNVNDVLQLIETIASQRITAVNSANRLVDATFDYDVQNGRVVQEAVIEMAKSYAYDKNALDRAPKDPTLHVRYFNNYTERQFETTIRTDDIRKIIANKGQGVEDIVAQILATLTAGESNEDFENTRALILNEYVPDYSKILGGKPKNLKGVIYAARNMYNHLKSNNSDLTEDAGTENAFISATPAEDIRVAMTESLLNLIDVVELANIFNLTKEELFGVMVVIPDSDLPVEKKYKVVVYDRKAMGKALFAYDFTQEFVAKGRFRNEYLTVSRAYFYNELFKACQLDCSEAANAALGDLIKPLPVFSALASTDELTTTNNLVVNLKITGKELAQGIQAVTTATAYQTVYVVGSESNTSATQIALRNTTGVFYITYNGVDLISVNQSGTNLSFLNVDPQSGMAKVPARSGAIGELLHTDKDWNGTIIGMYKVVE